MSYYLLTGATGLLGAYLLRDGLRAGRSMAVLVRPSRNESGRQRIEALLSRWEKEDRAILPRPVVLEGDLSEIDLGLDGATRDWIERHCEAVIHNAASLTFEGSNPEREPWLSNLEGTRRMLELCRCTGIRQFHHVSTAYVCGLREGRVLESELDVGQTLGNDYERSKVAAEKLVRQAGFLDAPTFYRPSIIVGDSVTGYTSTFHGFYVPLKLAHTLVSKVQLGVTGGQRLVEHLGMLGQECKNFVPVDWVSTVMTSLWTRPECRGRTYHLTAPQPVRLALMAKTIQEVVEAYSPVGGETSSWSCDGEWFERTFRDQMEIYRSYWRDDPQFDCTNTQAWAPHLPCPVIDGALMKRLALFAIESSFGRRRVRIPKPQFDVHSHLHDLCRSWHVREERPTDHSAMGLEVHGPGGGQWKILLRREDIIGADEGLPTKNAARIRLNSKTFSELAACQVTVRQAVHDGQVAIEPNGLSASQLESALHRLATSPGKQRVALT